MLLLLSPDVFAVVTKRNKTFRLSVFCDETVPPFGPTLPNPPEFDVNNKINTHKIINMS